MAYNTPYKAMIWKKTSAEDGSIAIDGDVNGNVNSIKIDKAFILFNKPAANSLPSYLSEIIVAISEESISEYGKGNRRDLPPDVETKLKYNNYDTACRLLTEYRMFTQLLDKAYLGAESRNADARFLVRRKTGVIYEAILADACELYQIAEADRDGFARLHSNSLVDRLIGALLKNYSVSSVKMVEEETAHLAISLIVADAIVECEVLQRPAHVAPT